MEPTFLETGVVTTCCYMSAFLWGDLILHLGCLPACPHFLPFSALAFLLVLHYTKVILTLRPLTLVIPLQGTIFPSMFS